MKSLENQRVMLENGSGAADVAAIAADGYPAICCPSQNGLESGGDAGHADSPVCKAGQAVGYPHRISFVASTRGMRITSGRHVAFHVTS